MGNKHLLAQIEEIKEKTTTDLEAAIDEFAALCKKEGLRYHTEALTFQGRFSDYQKTARIGSNRSDDLNIERTNIRVGFLKLLSVTEKELQETEQTIPSNLTPEYPKFNPQIVAIDTTTKTIFGQLQKSDNPLVIHGVGGMGKSTLAQSIYKQFKTTFSHYGWIPAREDFKSAFVEHDKLLEGLDILPLQVQKGEKSEDKFREIAKSLKSLQGTKLLVLDGADWELQEDEFLFLDSLQREYGYKLLITSRITPRRFKPVEMPKLNEIQAAEIFYLYYGKSVPETIDTAVADLLRFIGYHPLLIELCAKTLRESWDLTAADILERFKANNLQSIEETVSREMDYKQDTITGLLKVVFDMAGLTEDEKLLLMHLSVLCSQPVSFEDLCFVFNQEENKAGFKKQLDVLIQKGWIDREGKSVMVHPAVGVAVKSVIRPDEENCKVLVVDFIDKLNHLQQERPETAFSQTYYLFLLESIGASIRGEIEAIAGLYHKLASVYQALGNLESALEYQQKDIAISEKVLSSDHPDLAISYANLASIYFAQNQKAQVIEYVQRAIKILEINFPNGHPNLTTCLNNLAYYKS